MIAGAGIHSLWISSPLSSSSSLYTTFSFPFCSPWIPTLIIMSWETTSFLPELSNSPWISPYVSEDSKSGTPDDGTVVTFAVCSCCTPIGPTFFFMPGGRRIFSFPSVGNPWIPRSSSVVVSKQLKLGSSSSSSSSFHHYLPSSKFAFHTILLVCLLKKCNLPHTHNSFRPMTLMLPQAASYSFCVAVSWISFSCYQGLYAMEAWRKRTIQLLGFSHVQSPPPFYILSILVTSSSSSSLSISSKTHYNTLTPSEEMWQHKNMHIYPWWSDCREKLHRKMLWRKELAGVLLTLFASASILSVPARSSSMLLLQLLLLLLLYPKCLYLDRLTPWRNADHHVFAMKKWLMWHHLNNLRALLLFLLQFERIREDEAKISLKQSKRYSVEAAEICFPISTMIFRSLQLGLEFVFQMWGTEERTRRKNKILILESKSSFQAPTHWNWVAKLWCQPKRQQSNLKQESSICCKTNKQARRKENLNIENLFSNSTHKTEIGTANKWVGDYPSITLANSTLIILSSELLKISKLFLSKSK